MYRNFRVFHRGVKDAKQTKLCVWIVDMLNGGENESSVFRWSVSSAEQYANN